MEFDKIIYFRYIPLTAKIYEDFYMKQAEDAGIKIEYWDFSSLVFACNWGQEDTSCLMNVIRFSDYREIERALQCKEQVAKTLFVSLVTYDGLVTKFFSLLTKYNCKIAYFARNVLPSIRQETSMLYKLKRVVSLNKSSIVNYFRNRSLQRLKDAGKIKGYDVIFLAGRRGWDAIGCVARNEINSAQIVRVNSDDYDKCLLYKDSERLIDGAYILFLDQYLPLHPDVKLLKLKSVDAAIYYEQLNAFFDRVEKQFSLPVVIAAHPKALKYHEKNYFQGRRVFFGKSKELSRDADFVMTHNSTAVNLCVSFGARLHFITSHDIETVMDNTHRYTLMFAKTLGCNWQYFDDLDPVCVVDQVSRESYDQYKWDYLTSEETENKVTEQIFIDYLKS